MEYSVLLPVAPIRHEQVLPFAAFVQWSNATRLWTGQTLSVDPYQAIVHAAGSGFRVPVGVGVSLTPLRHPLEAAFQARSLAIATGHPLLAGFGPAAVEFQAAMLPAPYKSPLTAMREYLLGVRAALDGERFRQEGDYFPFRMALPPVPSPPIDLGLGVLRPGMARLAGEVADAAITWLTPASYVGDVVVPAVAEGAESAGRPPARVVAMVPLALAEEGRDPAQVALLSNRGHLSLPHYRDMLRRSGIDVSDDEDQIEDGAAKLVEGGAFLYGTADEVAARLAEYEAAGTDEVVLNLTAVCAMRGAQGALAEIEAVLAAAGR